MGFFKSIIKVVEGGAKAVGDAAKVAVEAQVKIVTQPVIKIAEAAKIQPVADVVKKVENTTTTIAGGAINAGIQKVTDLPVTAFNAADKVAQGKIGEALEELKDGVVRHVIATNPITATTVDAVRAYRGALQEQAKNKWQTLPSELIDILKPHYDFDLEQIRFATDINTVHGQAITFEYEIFFPKNVDFRTYDDLRWLLHELEHTQQYKDVGGFEPFVTKYLLNGAAKIIQHKSVNIHDEISLEKDADKKRDSIIETVFSQYVHQPVARPLM